MLPIYEFAKCLIPNTHNTFFFNLQVLLQAFQTLFIIWGNSLAEGGYSCTSIPYCLGFEGLFMSLIETGLCNLS